MLGNMYRYSANDHVWEVITHIRNAQTRKGFSRKQVLRAFTAVELKSYNAILAPLIYQKYLAAVEVKQKNFAALLQCTSIYRCAL